MNPHTEVPHVRPRKTLPRRSSDEVDTRCYWIGILSGRRRTGGRRSAGSVQERSSRQRLLCARTEVLRSGAQVRCTGPQVLRAGTQMRCSGTEVLRSGTPLLRASAGPQVLQARAGSQVLQACAGLLQACAGQDLLRSL